MHSTRGKLLAAVLSSRRLNPAPATAGHSANTDTDTSMLVQTGESGSGAADDVRNIRSQFSELAKAQQSEYSSMQQCYSCIH